MSRLTDKISYLQGLAEGMKLKPEKDSHRLILSMLEVLGEVGDTLDALVEAQGEIVERINEMDDELTELEDDLCEEDCDPEGEIPEDGEDEDFPEDEEDGDIPEDEDGIPGPEGLVLYECPHCHTTVEIDPDSGDLNEESPCPACGKKLFPEALEEKE